MYTPSLYDIVMILVASVATWCVAYILGKAVGFHAHLKSVSDSLDRGNAYAAAVKDIEMFCTDHSKAASLITRYIRVVAGRGKERPSPIDLAFELVAARSASERISKWISVQGPHGPVSPISQKLSFLFPFKMRSAGKNRLQ